MDLQVIQDGTPRDVEWVNADRLNVIWLDVLELLEASQSMWSEYYTDHDLYMQIMAGKMQLFTSRSQKGSLEMAVITSVESFPRKKVLHIIWCAGDNLYDHTGLLTLIENTAQSVGVDEVQIYGRKGWLRALAPYGYLEAATVTRKQLTNERLN